MPIEHDFPVTVLSQDEFHAIEKQLLHYLFLLGLHHGKLINFSSSSVTSRFVSKQMTNANRRHFRLVDRWFEREGFDDKLVFEILQALLARSESCGLTSVEMKLS